MKNERCVVLLVRCAVVVVWWVCWLLLLLLLLVESLSSVLYCCEHALHLTYLSVLTPCQAATTTAVVGSHYTPSIAHCIAQSPRAVFDRYYNQFIGFKKLNRNKMTQPSTVTTHPRAAPATPHTNH